VRQALDISAAFGGANAVLVYGAPDRERVPSAPRDPAPVVVRGLGAVSSAGVGVAALARAVAAGVPVAGSAVDFDLAAIVPTADPRRLDPSSRLLTAAAGLALRDAGLVLRGERRDQTGLFLAAARMPAESSLRCQETLDRHGPTGMSAAAFARMSVNAPAGTCCKHLSLRGPCTTVSIGAGSGLFGIAYAADWLARRQDARALVAGAVDEAPARPEAAAGSAPAFEGATAVVLERAAADLVEGDILIAGWALGGPDDLAGTARAALGSDGALDGVFCDGSPDAVAPLLAGRSPALGICDVAPIAAGETCASSLAFALAVLALRERRVRSLLVLAARSRSASVAVLLRRSGR
jgi:3-oxoacyl-[acyl-carrier-protein] synthase II